MGRNGGQQENISMKWEHSSVEVAGAIAIFIRSEGMVPTSVALRLQPIAQGTCTVNCPGLVMEITPPQVQKHFELLFNVGKLLSKTVGTPGTHGAGITGTQGIGVRTPKAAAVALATAGLANELHIPKGKILTSGT